MSYQNDKKKCVDLSPITYLKKISSYNLKDKLKNNYLYKTIS